MLHVRNFLRSVHWTGEVPGLGQVPAQSADKAMGRAARMLLENIADLLPSRGYEAGVRDLEKSKLSGQKYEPSSVRTSLRTLKRAGLVETRRTRDKRTGLEGYSTVILAPVLVGLARRWQAGRLELKGASKDRKKEIQAELLKMQNVNLPFLYDHPGNPHEQGLAADPLLNLSTHRCSKLATPNTGIHAPPGGGDDSVGQAALALPVGPAVPAPSAGAADMGDPPGGDPVPSSPPSGEGGRESFCESLSKTSRKGGDGERVRHSDVVSENLKNEGEHEGEPRGSDVVRKNFEITRVRRAACSREREEGRRQRADEAEGEPLARPWRLDGRPCLREWAPAHQDSTGSKILIEGDQSIFFEVRAFAATLDAFHWYQPGHTSLSLMQPDRPGAEKQGERQGRLPIFTQAAAGSWCEIDWQKVFHFAWARSQQLFEKEGTGEQIFAAPTEKSRMILVDDLQTSVPIFEKTFCIVLETSRGNYQHLYCSDRVLTPAQRHHIQSQIAAEFGGDRGATSGAQPHRVPGSVNYKKDRNLFVCRLVGTVGEIDGGKPLAVDEYLCEMPAAVVQKNEQRTCKKIVKSVAQTGGTDASASGQDWHKSIVKAAALKGAGMDAAGVFEGVEKMLLKSAQSRGKNDVDYYVNRTLKKLVEAGHL